MAKKKHKRGLAKNRFCGIPGNSPTACKCGNDYIGVCKPHWANFTFMRLVRSKKIPAYVFGKKFEAHHILCVSPVASEIIANEAIDSVIAKTVWCINNKTNMMAMPLWGHTVRWYCSVDLGEDANIGAPDFLDIPQHDWDHNTKKGYTFEIETVLKDIAAVIKDAGHEIDPQDISTALTNQSKEFARILGSRGKRRGGTHKAWQTGGKERRWYEPFSMASSAALTAKGFPAKSFDKRMLKWIKRIAKGMAGP